MRSGTTDRNTKALRDRITTALGVRQPDPSPIEGVPLRRGGSLLDWHETGPQHYVGGDYEITLIEPFRWEIRYRGEHVEFDDSREYSFAIAENHYREILRTQDLKTYFGVAVASAVALVGLLTLPRGNPVWVVAAGLLWVIHAYAALSVLYTLARLGRLRCGARYARPFGKATYRAVAPHALNSS